MAAKAQGPAGCWTCRVRRKKCDERRPVCEGCIALEIDCLYSGTKPEWMDNGRRQKAMADMLKTEVKNRAAWRREKRDAQAIQNGTAAISLTAESFGELIITSLPKATSQASTAASDISMTHPPLPVFQGRGSHQDSEFSTPPDDLSSIPHTLSPETTDSLGLLMADMQPSFTAASAGPFSDAVLTNTAMGQITPLAGGQTSGSDPFLQPFVPTLAAPSLDEERELTFIMKYLDYVFPFLYPFYRPSLLSPGRGWLLVSLMKNKAVFHSALSLASYFFTVTISQLSEGHDACKRHIYEELHKQQELSLRELQCNIGDLNRLGVRGYLAESARAVESIIQLLYFEAIISPLDSCYMHLDAALVLFEQIMENHAVVLPGENVAGTDDAPPSRYSWRLIMDRLSPFPPGAFGMLSSEPIPYNCDMAALRFYTSVLLYIDVIASTMTETPPRLRKYHAALMRPLWNLEAASDAPISSGDENNNSEPCLDVDEVIGIENWVLLVISEVSTLASWKKQAVQSKKLSVTELVRRASPIEAEIRARLACYETRMAGGGCKPKRHDDDRVPAIQGVFFQSYLPETKADLHAGKRQQKQSRSHMDAISSVGSAAVSFIWGYAALTYQLVVVNGWQPELDAIRQSVDRTLHLITDLPSSSWLRTIAWPFCVTGCLATKAQEPVFRDMVGQICGLEVYGSVQQALRIMEAVWAERDSDRNGKAEWDLAKCFHVLGRRAFMV